jgi:hypothetical protein
MRNHFEQKEYVKLVNNPSKVFRVIIQKGSRVTVAPEHLQSPEVIAERTEIFDRSLLERL